MKANFPRILAIEAATRTQSIALLHDDNVLEHRQQRVRFDHGSVLLQNIDAIVKAQRLSIHDIDLFAVGLGPGSFTGLRVALAVAKSLATATKKPLVGVSSLASLAYPQLVAHPGATVCAMIDARRNEVYAGFYRLQSTPDATGPSLHALEPERAAEPQSLAKLIEKHATPSQPVIIAGTAHLAYPDIDLWNQDFLTLLPAWSQQPDAVATAILARAQAAATLHNHTQTVAELSQLEPNYIRPSDAKLPAHAPWLKAIQ